MMQEHIELTKDDLLGILRTCLHPPRVEYEEEYKFKTHIKKVVSHIWNSLAQNEYKDVEHWLLSCRVGIIGLQFYYYTDRFFVILDNLWNVSLANKHVNVPELSLNVTVENVETFRVSVCYGFMSLLSRFTCLFPEKETRRLYTIIFENCMQQNRHYQLYYQLLANYVESFSCLLTSQDFDNIFTVLCYNVDKKETSALLKTVMTKCENFNSEIVFHILTSNASWSSKHKYVFLNDILSHDSTIIYQVRHEDFAIGLFHGISKQHLSPISGKLYHNIVKVIHEDLWTKYYYPSIYRLLTSPEVKITFCQKNLVKYFLPKTFERFPHIFQKLLDAVETGEDAPTFSLLSLVLIGKKHSLLQADFDLNKIINFGIEHYDQEIRNMAFEVLCVTETCDSLQTLNKIKKFIIVNINAADQPNREMLKKTFDNFLRKLQKYIIRKKNTTDEPDGQANIADFLNWLIPFLLNNFHKHHNYQRITLSLHLIYMTTNYFSLAACVDVKQPFADSLKTFIVNYDILLHFKNKMGNFVHMLTVCTGEKDKILDLIFKQFLPKELLHTDINIDEILTEAKTKICDCNMSVSDIGEKLMQFAMRYMDVIRDPQLETELQTLQEMMHLQWTIIKTSEDEDVIANRNPLHSLISVTTTLLDYYDSKENQSLMDFIEDIVYASLSVFELRTMVPFRGEFCKGVAKTFANEESEYFPCTVNCMWLTLKACCKLAAKILNMFKTDVLMYRTLEIIFSIIRRCYHKGALEVAGSTLSEIVNFATKSGHNITIIDIYLSNVLEGLQKIPQIINNSTVRRAAETRVFLGAVAVSDKRFNIPLFHKTMGFLVSFLGKCVVQMESDPLPVMHCLILHCLRPIILDTAVEIHIVEYLDHVTVLCLQSFESFDWTVRNAALQTFSAITIRMLGQNTSPSDDCSQQHAVSLEEIFFRYPKIYSYMLLKLTTCRHNYQSRLNIVIPIITFIGMSYVRGNEFSNLDIKFQMDSLSKCITGYIFCSKRPQIFMLAAKAFTAVSAHKEIEGQIERLIGKLSSGSKLSKNEFVATMFTLKLLFEKIIDNAQTSLNKNSIMESVEAHLQSVLLMTSCTGDVRENVLAGLLLVRKGVTNIDVKMIYGCISFLNTRSELPVHIPTIWTWVEKHLEQLFPTGNEQLVIDIFTKLIFDKVPTSLKLICFKGLTERISQMKKDNFSYNKILVNTLINYLYNNVHIPEKILAEPCILLIVELNISDFNSDLFSEMQDKLINLEINEYHDSYMIVSCLALNHFRIVTTNITEFYYWCADKCATYANEDNLDVLVLKSVIYISEYAMRNKLPELKLRALKLCYNMLQLGIEELNYECAKITSYCFEKDMSYAYKNMLSLINPKNLIPLLGTRLTLQFFVQIFVEQTDECSVEINVFDQKPTLSIDTGIFTDDLLSSIKDLAKDLTETELENTLQWFSTFSENKNSHYFSQVQSVFEWIFIFGSSS